MDGDKVYIPAELTLKCLETLPSRDDLKLYWLAKNPLSLNNEVSNMGLIGNIYYIHDYDTDTVRVATNQDLEDKDCVLNSLNSFSFNMSNVFVLPGHEAKSTPFYDDLINIENIVKFLDTRVINRRGKKTKDWIPHILMRPEGYTRLEFLAYAIISGYSKATQMYTSSQYANTAYPMSFTNPISPLHMKDIRWIM